MTSQQPFDPALLNQLTRRCRSLAREVDAFGDDLHALAGAAPAPAKPSSVDRTTGPATTPPTRVPHPAPSPALAAARPAAQRTTRAPSVPVNPFQTPEGPGVTVTREPPAPPWWQRDGVVSRVLALGGVAITLAGVVMLLVLAGRAGLLRPEVRVGAGALLAVALVAVAGRVHGRPGGRVGAIALAATGLAAVYLDIVAVTSHYHWLHPWVGLVLAGLVALGGAWTALRWGSPQLAVIVTAACAVTAPALTGGLTLSLVLFYLVLQSAGAVPELLRGWSVLAPVRTAPVACALLLRLLDSISVWDVSERPGVATVLVGTLVCVIGLAAGILGAHGALGTTPQSRPQLAALSAGVATVPFLYTAWLSARPVALGLGFGAFIACATAFLLLTRLDDLMRTVLASAGGIGLLVGCLNIPGAHGNAIALPFLVVAVVAAALATRTRSWYVRGYTVVYASIGLGFTADAVGARALSDVRLGVERLDWSSVGTGALALALAVLVAAAVLRSELDTHRPVALLACGAVALYAVTAVAVAVPVALARNAPAFHLGHFVATTLWAVSGCLILAVGLARPALARVCLAGGLTTIAAAVTKLVTYDLASLSGFTRAATFLVTGLLLLVAGTRYARAFGERAGTPDASAPGASTPA